MFLLVVASLRLCVRLFFVFCILCILCVLWSSSSRPVHRLFQPAHDASQDAHIVSPRWPAIPLLPLHARISILTIPESRLISRLQILEKEQRIPREKARVSERPPAFPDGIPRRNAGFF